MPKPISAAKSSGETALVCPIRVVIVTMDTHLATATARARARLMRQLPSLRLTMFAASEWANDDQLLGNCIAEIGQADIVVVTMLFLEEHFLPILPALQARRGQ